MENGEAPGLEFLTQTENVCRVSVEGSCLPKGDAGSALKKDLGQYVEPIGSKLKCYPCCGPDKLSSPNFLSTVHPTNSLNLRHSDMHIESFGILRVFETSDCTAIGTRTTMLRSFPVILAS